LKDLLESTISWSKIGKHPKESYHYSIEKAVVSKETAVLSMNIRLNFIIPYADVYEICKLIHKDFPTLKEVSLSFIYEDVILTEDEIIKHYINHMIYEINGDYAAITKTIFPKEYTYQNHKLTIMALGEMAVNELNSKVSKLLENLLLKNFGINIEVNFANHHDNYKEKSKEKAIREIKEIEEVAKVQNISDNKEKKKETICDSNIILGKDIKEEAVSLSSINVDSGLIAIEGMLFRKEARTIKNNKKLVTLLLTDKATSICIKLFLAEDKWNGIDENLNIGENLKIRGNVEYDTYENVLVVMGKDINKILKDGRQDNCPEKRVELHAHTKMSAMDGLNEVEDMVKTAARWGQKAIAITDHAVVQAFPEAAKIVKKNKLDLKIIYGVEGYLFDDINCKKKDGKIDYKSKSTNHVIILAKNQEGIKNLYKLVSISHLEYFYKKPRIPKSVLTLHRDGLLIGSACEAGEVYRSIIEDKSKEEIENIIDYYDYLEIQPLINNQFLIDNGTVKSSEELKGINKRIIALGKEHNKPVVATCDAHYSNPEEALYSKML